MQANIWTGRFRVVTHGSESCSTPDGTPWVPAGRPKTSSRAPTAGDLAATGQSNPEITKRLFVTRVTVKTHNDRPMAKLGARDRARLGVIAHETGLVCAGERRTDSTRAPGRSVPPDGGNCRGGGSFPSIVENHIMMARVEAGCT